MAIRLRFWVIGIGAGAALYAGMLGWYGHEREQHLGLTDQPCTAEGRAITGSDFDDWGSLCFYRADNKQLRARGVAPEVVLFGDSLTARWPASESGSNDAILNRGVNGQTSSQMLLRFRQDVLGLKPGIVHLLMGSNDVIGQFGPVTLDQFEGNLRDMVELAKASRLTVILGTIPPMGSYDGTRPGHPAPDIAKINAVIRTVAAQEQVVLADYHAALSDGRGKIRAKLFDADQVHMNAAGYAAIRPVFDQALARAREERKARGPS